MGKYVDTNEKINTSDLSELCIGVVVDGNEWQRKLAGLLSTYLSITDIMVSPVEYPDALKKDMTDDAFFLKDRIDWKQKYFVRDGLDPQDKEHIMLTYTEPLDKFKGIVYEEVRYMFRSTEINGLFEMEKVETFTSNIHNTAIRSAINISDDEYIRICEHGKQRAIITPVCLDGVKIANALNMDWYESQMAVIHKDGRVLELDNGNKYGDLITKEYPCKVSVQKTVADISRKETGHERDNRNVR